LAAWVMEPVRAASMAVRSCWMVIRFPPRHKVNLMAA
jgi:hypothetical protein